MYDSPLKFYRDQHKNPDLYNGGKPETREIQEMLAEDEQRKKEGGEEAGPGNVEKKVEIISPAAKDFIQTVDLVRNAKLKAEFASDKLEQVIFKERQDAILGTLKKVLDDVKNYMSSISYMIQMRQSEEVEQKKFLEQQVEAEVIRKRYHNKLISDLKIAARLINVSLNAEYSEELRLQEESKFPSRSGMKPEQVREALDKHEYYKFPHKAGALIDFQKMPRDPYAERKYIAGWAMSVYSYLAAIINDSSIDKHLDSAA
ncbi:MAG: hypothetical protein Q8Q67_01000 [bacterium]|nr:hypothetical protein [bacterium]